MHIHTCTLTSRHTHTCTLTPRPLSPCVYARWRRSAAKSTPSSPPSSPTTNPKPGPGQYKSESVFSHACPRHHADASRPSFICITPIMSIRHAHHVCSTRPSCLFITPSIHMHHAYHAYHTVYKHVQILRIHQPSLKPTKNVPCL